MAFNHFNFRPELARNIVRLGFTAPTPIQTQAIPPVMEGRDVLGLAQTGTGKTAAFGFPLLHRLLNSRKAKSSLRGLILAPTRELATQILGALDSYSKGTPLRTLAIFGGVALQPQITRLRKGCDIVVACPGRLLDHMERGTIDLSGLEMLVLDEADQMFDMGFLPTIRKIVHRLPKDRQTLLFSATMPDDIRLLARQLLGEPVRVQVGSCSPVDTVSHALYPVSPSQKYSLLLRVLTEAEPGSVLIFTKTKHRAKRVASQLLESGHRASALHGNLSQARRQAALGEFRSGEVQILVATDIAARGLDISSVTHVINFDMPNTPEAYTHRIGRTGRASKSGDAFTFVSKEDAAMVRAVERLLSKPIERRLIEGFEYEREMAGSMQSEQPRRHRRSGRGFGMSGNSSQSRFRGRRMSADMRP